MWLPRNRCLWPDRPWRRTKRRVPSLQFSKPRHIRNLLVAYVPGFLQYATARLHVDSVLSQTNTIRKQIELAAPVSRVWRALTDCREFGEWFRVKLDGPFTAGDVSRGRITWPGHEHVVWEAGAQRIEPESLFSFKWHPDSVDPEIDYSPETPTLVEFWLEATATGTLLVVTESGFE